MKLYVSICCALIACATVDKRPAADPVPAIEAALLARTPDWQNGLAGYVPGDVKRAVDDLREKQRTLGPKAPALSAIGVARGEAYLVAHRGNQ